MIRDVTTDSFEKNVLKADRPVLAEFYTQWCPSCRAMEPALEKLEKEFEGRADIVRINAEEEPELSMKFGIRGVPTLIIFKDGEVLDAMVGGRPPQVLRSKLEEATEADWKAPSC